MTIDIIAGCKGEVGRALHEVLGSGDTQVFGLDLGLDIPEWVREVDEVRRLHVAFPYHSSGFFEDQVRTYENDLNCSQVIVHSTVPIGVCELYGWYFSPVTGRHPKLADSLRTFFKPIAGPDFEVCFEIAESWRAVGIPAQVAGDSPSLEASKLIDLAWYGMEIRFEKEVKRLCEERDLDFEAVYVRASERYRFGYDQLGEQHLGRPTITHMPGPIGGHCVSENLPLLGDERIEGMVKPATKDGWDDALD